MKVTLEIPEYNENAVDVIWEDGSQYSLVVSGDTVELSANKQGLLSLAKQLLYFANNELPNGSHVHYSSFFCRNLESDYELIISKLK